MTLRLTAARSNQLSYGSLPDNDGTRTRNPQLRRLVRYPLRHIVKWTICVFRATGIEPVTNWFLQGNQVNLLQSIALPTELCPGNTPHPHTNERLLRVAGFEPARPKSLPPKGNPLTTRANTLKRKEWTSDSFLKYWWRDLNPRSILQRILSASPLTKLGNTSRVPPVGIEPTIFGLEGRRVIHCATEVSQLRFILSIICLNLICCSSIL